MGKNKIKILLSIFFSALLIVLLVFSFNSKEMGKVQAGAGDNVFGWAWSENIGWISFNSTSGEGSIDYGVNIDQITGIFSGYAWSENIGWISFNQSELSGCPSGDCWAKVDLSSTHGVPDHEVSGWARALAPVGNSQAGGWDGWIKLDGPSYGVEINDVTQEFEGWAWGGDDSDSTAVIGWISFNCNNPETPTACFGSDYKVKTSFAFNNSPRVESPEVKYQEYCGGLTGQGRIGFKWIYQDEDGDNQSRFDFRVNDINNVNDLNFEVNRTFQPLDNPIGTTNNQLVFIKSPLESDKVTFNKTYYWWARVWDNKGGNSGWVAGPSTTTDLHAWPYPDFTPSPQSPSVDQVVEFIDSSDCYDAGNNKYPCRNGGGDVSYQWDFDYDTEEGFIANSNYKGNATTSFPTSKPYTVRLQITDDLGTCGTNRTVNVTLPLPEWEEVAP